MNGEVVGFLGATTRYSKKIEGYKQRSKKGYKREETLILGGDLISTHFFPTFHQNTLDETK